MRCVTKSWLSGTAVILALSVALPASAAVIHTSASTAPRAPSVKHISLASTAYFHSGINGFARRGVGGGLQCVTFARSETGIELSGNAANWWDNAAGVYDRGSVPQRGAILNFRANGRMRLGHVSVVSHVVSGREILIDHANWSSRGGVSRGVSVVDVSPDNDWSAVRVRLGTTGEYGAVYPTYGFIYTRPAGSQTQIMTAAAEPMPELNPAPADLRFSYPHNYSYTRSYMHAPFRAHSVQVAMAPAPKHSAQKKTAKN